MIELDNDTAIELIKKEYKQYITDDIQILINKYDLYTNLLLGMIVAMIICAMIYGKTQIILFIVFVGLEILIGLFSSYQRKVYAKKVVSSINQQIQKQK